MSYDTTKLKNTNQIFVPTRSVLAGPLTYTSSCTCMTNYSNGYCHITIRSIALVQFHKDFIIVI